MNYIKSLYFGRLFYLGVITLVVLFVFGYFFEIVYVYTKLLTIGFFVLIGFDHLLLYRGKNHISARRELPEKLSNGDVNVISVFIENSYRMPVRMTLIDEIPAQFQVRDFNYSLRLNARSTRIITYNIRPIKRGEYSFGSLNIYVTSVLGLVKRRFIFDKGAMVPVYPSFMQMHKYELLAISQQLPETGIKRMRKLGHSMEFETIREYVPGDDPRSINWTATARKSNLMVNHYRDERSQQVYCIIDKGRTMQLPFEGLSLLDYSINASLVLANIALKKQDKAGLITFSDKMGAMLPADNKRTQIRLILETLYNQKTRYLESDYEMLYMQIRHKLHQRALLVLFANFGSLEGLKRQMPYLRSISRNHLLVVIFFEDTELDKLLNDRPTEVEGIYIKTIAEQFVLEKKQMVKELESAGIHAILIPPAKLTVAVINKYLELKARMLI